MAEKAVVIGSSCFSGSHFVDHLLDEGLSVLGVSRSPEPHRVFLPYKKNRRLDSFRFLQLDLNRDLDRILAAVDGFRPDYVVNFAAQGMAAQSWSAPLDWLQTNTVSMVRLHDGLRRRGWLKKFVHASTPEVYGRTVGRVTETTPCSPSTPCAVSRAACDMSLLAFHRQYNFPVVLTRSASVYGPGQQLYRVIPRAVHAILTGRQLPLQGGGTSTCCFIHIRDVAAATLAAARYALPGEVFHLGTEEEISIRGLMELICARMDADFKKVVKEAAGRPGLDSAHLLDCAKARRVLGWKPKISLEQGLDDAIGWGRSNLADLKLQPYEYVHQP